MSKTVVAHSADGDKTPFLKGILVRSLASIEIPFDDAYNLAQSIRDELKNEAEITSSELEERVAIVLERRFGKQVRMAYLARHQARSDIIVHTPWRSSAFSVGILSHSLEACAINPKLSIIGASKVLASIRKTGRKEIDHKSLRRLIYRCLCDHCSEKAAHKYLAWRRFHNSGRALIIMLGGATGTGKSAVAAELAYRLDISRTLSTDMMRDVIRSYLASQLTPSLQYPSYEAWRGLPPLSHALREDSKNRIIAGFLAQLSAMKPAIETAIERACQDQEHLVIEGVHIVPAEIEVCPEDKEVVCMKFMLAAMDKQSLKKRLQKRIREQKDRHSDDEFIDDIWQLQSWLLDQSDRDDIHIVPNINLEDSIREILEIASQIILRQFPPDLKAIEGIA